MLRAHGRRGCSLHRGGRSRRLLERQVQVLLARRWTLEAASPPRVQFKARGGRLLLLLRRQQVGQRQKAPLLQHR